MIMKILFSCFLLAAAGGIVSLQIFLSKKEDGRMGLVLPIISFIASLFPAISNTITLLNLKPASDIVFKINYFEPTMLLAYANMFLLINIITVVLIVIYVACRKKRKKQRALDKMSIQDLE